LAYADDIVILGTPQNKTENSANRLFKADHNMGLTVNELKTKCMVMSRHETSKDNLYVDGYSSEQAEE